MEDKRELQSAKEIASLLGVNARTVLRWAIARKVHCWRLGRTIRFDRREVLAAMDKYEFAGVAGDDPSLG